MPKITGTVSATKRLSALAGPKKVALVGQSLFSGGDKIKAEAAHLITQNAVSGKGHKPSRPGEPPNENTGHLRSRIYIQQVAPLRVQVISDAKYAVPLERGTSKMAARPSMGPAARNRRKEVIAGVNAAISFVTKKG